MEPVRAQQTDARRDGLVLAVAAATTEAGAALLASLRSHSDVAEVWPLDPGDGHIAPFSGRRADAVVVPPDAGAGSAAYAVAAAAAGASVSGRRRVVIVTGAEVYGARPDNPVPLREDAPLRARGTTERLTELLEVEVLAARAAQEHPRLGVTVLRPATLVGPGLRNPLAGHFGAPRLLAVPGTESRWQFCHVADLADAVVLASAGRVPGVATVACEGWLEQEQVEAITGLRRVELPASLVFATAQRLQRLGLVAATGSDLAYVVHPWVVPSARLHAVGWRARHDNVTVLRELVAAAGDPESRWPGARDATLASAGAAVAVVGTAALVRAARRRRRG